ncbi:hypothetical protein N0V82_007923 [Gnomoniopsis sp. IMI 355080]|nr:hypothetical protein N0V82_007923 [Gnomoniopsis sp. IMI 355080]
MSNTSSSVARPESAHSKTARLACWLTGGGTRHSPTTAVSFLKMAGERNTVERAEAEWDKRKKAALDVHLAQWGNMGPTGTLEEVAAIGPRPRGRALVRWWIEQGGREGSVSGLGRTTGEWTTTADLAQQRV